MSRKQKFFNLACCLACMLVCPSAQTNFADCGSGYARISGIAAPVSEPLWNTVNGTASEFEAAFGVRYLESNEISDEQQKVANSAIKQIFYSSESNLPKEERMIDELLDRPERFNSVRASILADFAANANASLEDLSHFEILVLSLPHLTNSLKVSSKTVPKASPTHLSVRHINEQIGRGVFAEADIPKGGWIGEYTGIVSPLSKDTTESEYDMGYLTEWNMTLRPKNAGNITRFINHSNEPNVSVAPIVYHGQLYVGLIANRPIKKGEQIVFDYGPDHWEDMGKKPL